MISFPEYVLSKVNTRILQRKRVWIHLERVQKSVFGGITERFSMQWSLNFLQSCIYQRIIRTCEDQFYVACEFKGSTDGKATE